MMDNAQIAKSSLNDIVFEGRNKAYGAYVLRRLYQRHVTRALIIATAVFLLLIAFPLISQFLKDRLPKEPKKNLQENVLMDAPPLDDTKPPPPPPPPEAPSGYSSRIRRWPSQRSESWTVTASMPPTPVHRWISSSPACWPTTPIRWWPPSMSLRSRPR